MRATTIALLALFLSVFAFVLCWCCRRRRMRGQVLQPPQAVVVTAADARPAPYPQQTYHSLAPPPQQNVFQATSPYPTANTTAYPAAGAPYPTSGAPQPNAGAPYPTIGATHPNTGTPYPTSGAPYPTGGAPYPTGGATYPTGGQGHMLGIEPGHLTVVPPPSYSEAMTNEAYTKQPSYNPNCPQ